MMRKLVLTSACLLTTALAACAVGTKVTTENQTGSGAEKADAATEEASQRKNPLFKDDNLIGRQNFPLTVIGQKALPTFLAQIGLTIVSSLEDVAGQQKFNRQICEAVFAKFKVENPASGIKGEQCGWNLNKDGTYADVDPLVFSLSELDGKYFLLLIDEEGRGAPKLFTYLYDLKSGRLQSFARPSLGETAAYYHDGILYFVNTSGYLELAFDLKNMKPIPIESPPS